MEAKLNETIDKIVKLSTQNAEFGKELRKRLGQIISTSALGDERLDQIYEYCIEKVVRRQAEEFYADFPIKGLVPGLVDDFCRMEAFRRKDCFGDFCLALYQQLECIANQLCINPDLCAIAEHMWGYPAYVTVGKDITPSIENRWEHSFPIANFVFGKSATEKSAKSLQSLCARDKLRVVIYFVGYNTLINGINKDDYKEYMNLLSDIYQCRNTNHRGNVLEEWQQSHLDRVLAHKSVYYFKFLGALNQFVEMIKEGWTALPAMRQQIQRLPKKPVKEVSALNVVREDRSD